jgi:leucyl aminopeptidase
MQELNLESVRGIYYRIINRLFHKLFCLSRPFPCDSDFEEDLKSDIADVLQCRVATEADHIYAFSFLKRFVSVSVPWLHFDLASAHRPGGLGHIESDYTGAGVRLAVEFIKEFIKKK